MLECQAFLKEHNGREIVSMEDPNIHVVDQYIKMVMDGMMQSQVPGMRSLVDNACQGSPLRALSLIATAKAIKAEGTSDGAFMSLLADRLRDDIALKVDFNSSSAALKARATAQLKKRGLLK